MAFFCLTKIVPEFSNTWHPKPSNFNEQKGENVALLSNQVWYFRKYKVSVFAGFEKYLNWYHWYQNEYISIIKDSTRAIWWQQRHFSVELNYSLFSMKWVYRKKLQQIYIQNKGKNSYDAYICDAVLTCTANNCYGTPFVSFPSKIYNQTKIKYVRVNNIIPTIATDMQIK